jgi:hypothetical protein
MHLNHQQRSPEMQAMLDQMLEQRNGRMTVALDKATVQLKQVETKDRIELDEYYFFHAFLHFFAGDKELMYFKDDPAPGLSAQEKAKHAWINVAGGPFNEVHIVRTVNGQKEVIGVVPPMLSRAALKPVETREGEGSVAHAVQTANLVSNHSPMQGQRVLEAKLGERLDRMNAIGVRLEDAKQWNKIFKHYGAPLIPVPGDAETQPTQQQEQGGEEIEGFDPI